MKRLTKARRAILEAIRDGKPVLMLPHTMKWVREHGLVAVHEAPPWASGPRITFSLTDAGRAALERGGTP